MMCSYAEYTNTLAQFENGKKVANTCPVCNKNAEHWQNINWKCVACNKFMFLKQTKHCFGKFIVKTHCEVPSIFHYSHNFQTQVWKGNLFNICFNFPGDVFIFCSWKLTLWLFKWIFAKFVFVMAQCWPKSAVNLHFKSRLFAWSQIRRRIKNNQPIDFLWLTKLRHNAPGRQLTTVFIGH